MERNSPTKVALRCASTPEVNEKLNDVRTQIEQIRANSLIWFGTVSAGSLLFARLPRTGSIESALVDESSAMQIDSRERGIGAAL
jgi:hypothetical protein